MQCPKCSAELPTNSKFCLECGASMATGVAASAAGGDYTSLIHNYIPPELVKKILSAGKQIESERRLVTVLFADISGFTAMSEKMDPEAVSTVLNDCFKGLISIIYKYEGVIDKFIGDEIMAIFGAPITHEDDAERAVRCAMEMMEFIGRFNRLSPVELPEPLGMHVGMNTGMVVAGNVGSDLRMNYSVIGDTVNLASRLSHVAQTGEVVISADTHRFTSAFIETDEPRMVEVKGKAEPVETYKLRALKSDIAPGTRRMHESSFVGRGEELAIFNEAIQQLVNKKGSRIFVRGEAGVGKSRLKLEVAKMAKTGHAAIFEGKCSSFEINTPYYLWTTLLRDILGLTGDSGENESRKLLRDTLQILRLEASEPYLATLLSLRYEEILLEDDQVRKGRIFESVGKLLLALSARKRCLILLEDLHWVDKFSQELLAYIYEIKELTEPLMVMFFRDEYSRHTSLRRESDRLMDLNRLEKEDARQLICARLQATDVPSEIMDLVYQRSEGNPFFIEELVKNLLENKIVAPHNGTIRVLKQNFQQMVPGTVQAIIMARLDTLQEKLKEVVLGASVIGREFDRKLLHEILKPKTPLDKELAELRALELILEKGQVNELVYLFKHYLIQEVAYGTILQKRRKQLHGLIAKAIESVYAARLKEFYELLAFHYERAEEWEKAAEYLSRAGNKVREIYTKEESQDYQRRTDAVKAKLIEGRTARNWKFLTFQLVYILWGLLVNVSFVAEWIQIAQHWFINNTLQLTLPRVLWLLFNCIGYPFLVIVTIRLYQVLSNRPRAFSLFGDHIEIIYDNGKSQKIPFAEIGTFHLYVKPKQILPKFTSDYHLSGLASLALNSQRINPSSFGFGSSKGEIHLRKKSGLGFYDLESIFKPWLYNIMARRDIALTPSEPEEFYNQLVTAYRRWAMPEKKIKRATETMENAAISKAYPLLEVRPNVGLLSTFFTLNQAFYMILIGCFMCFGLFITINSIPNPHPQRPYDFTFVFVCIGILGAGFVAGGLWTAKQRRKSMQETFMFLPDRLLIKSVFDYSVRMEIPYSVIERLKVPNKRLSRVLKNGEVLLMTNTILSISKLYGLANTGLVMQAIDNPHEVVEKITEILDAYRKSELNF